MRIFGKAIGLALFCSMLALTTGCSGNGTSGPRAGVDSSIYSFENIKKIHLRDPERALAMTDSAEMMGVIGADSCNWLRGLIHYGATKDFPEARRHIQKVLDSRQADKTSQMYLRNFSLMMSTYELEENYSKCLEYCLEGARLAHEAGDLRRGGGAGAVRLVQHRADAGIWPEEPLRWHPHHPEAEAGPHDGRGAALRL